MTAEDVDGFPHSFSCMSQFFSWHSFEQYQILEQPEHSNLGGFTLHSWHRVAFLTTPPVAPVFENTTLAVFDDATVLGAPIEEDITTVGEAEVPVNNCPLLLINRS